MSAGSKGSEQPAGVLVVAGGPDPLPAGLTTDLAALTALGVPVHLLAPHPVPGPVGVVVHRPVAVAGSWVQRLVGRRAGAGAGVELPDPAVAALTEVGTVVVATGVSGSDAASGGTSAEVGAVLAAVTAVRADLVPGPEPAGDLVAARLVSEQTAVLHRLDELVRAGDGATAQTLAAGLGPATGPLVTATAEALLGCLALSAGEPEGVDVVGRAAEVTAAADAAWPHHPGAVYALAAAVRLLFHPSLHVETLAPPLAADPDAFLAPLRGSTMFAAVTSARSDARVGGRSGGSSAAAATKPVDGAETAGGAGAGDRPAGRGTAGVPQGIVEPGPDVGTDRRRVLVLTGSYPRFAVPLVAALGEDPALDVEALSLGEREPALKWLGPNTRALAVRVAEHPDAPAVPTLETRLEVAPELFDGVDVAWAEWADRGAMWAASHLPAGVRLVVRCHGIDVMSSWAQLIDWSRVDDAVFVSAPLRDLARAVLGPRLAGVRLHVVEHAVDADRFDVPAPPGRERVLGMIGWGRVVKDPLWTLDVLAELVAADPSWRLLLVGHPLSATDQRSRGYDQQLTARLAELGDHVEQVDQTDDVAAQAARMGFVISSSRRESFHLGLLEGVAAGAVPVVRDWPSYLGRTGPRGIYPDGWVVDTPAAAATRIRSLADPATRDDAAAEARAHAVETFSPTRFAAGVRAVLAAG